jgi:hypothetical protein
MDPHILSDSNQGPRPSQGASRIAVVAIHGVGDHPPFEMARSVAALLQDERTLGALTNYTAFEESLIRIDVEPVKPPCRFFDCVDQAANDPLEHMKSGKAWGPLDEIYRARFPVEASGTGSLDHLFMEGQLSCYRRKGPEDNYQFLRLSGKREKGPEVHIYDMYWADLSKFGNAFTQVFGELYQLLFHLASVGANTVKAAAIAFGYSPAWIRFAGFEALAAAILAWLIPFLNLIMFAFLIPALAASILRRAAPTALSMILVVTITALTIAAMGSALLRFGSKKRWLFPIPVGLGCAVCGLAWWRISTLSIAPSFRGTLEAVAALLALAATLLAIWQVIAIYQKRRPGSKRAFLRIFVGFAAIAVIAILRHGPVWGEDKFAVLSCLRCLEVALWLLVFSWVLFSVVCVFAYVSGLFAVRSIPVESSEERREARGAHRTGWLVLGLSGTIFFLVSLFAWGILTEISKPILPPSSYEPLYPPGSQPLSGLIDGALSVAGLAFAPILLSMTLLGLVIAIWSFAPAVWGEVFPPDSRAGDDQHKTDAMGHWLTNGFSFLLAAGAILWLSLIVSYPVLIARNVFHPSPHRLTLEALGALVGGSGISLLVLRGRLNSAAGGFRTGVRVALDVDAWLREHPRDSNPTGQICARYVSLLRHVANAKKSGKGYDAVIIFAHSQGTVITADLLRFLAVEHDDHYYEPGGYDPSLHGLGTSEIPIYLFTMGCPLRQLYSRRFPSLYTYGARLTERAIVSESSDLGVIQWVNAFRSGDYVGRGLWSDNFVLNRPASAAATKDLCIGPGAHTHYWDHTAKTIGEKLDKMIAGVGADRTKPVKL